MQGDRERCLAAGMNDYITKPLARSDLARVLEATKPKVMPVTQSSPATIAK